MAGRDDNYTFHNRRWGKNSGRGRRNMPVRPPSPPAEGFGGGGILGNASRYLKKVEKYNPAQQYLDTTAKSSTTTKETKDNKHQKTKFVNLYGESGQERLVMKLPGRHECNCQATMHALVNNCLKCGRIICEQEGSGPCFFCSSLVCSRDEQKMLDQGGRKATELRNRLLLLPPPKPTSKKSEDGPKEEEVLVGNETNTTSKGTKGKSSSSSVKSAASSSKDVDKGLEKALAEKDRLLEYQRSSARRTMVYDDESDYFNTSANPWLTAEEKEKLGKREEELRALQNMPRSQRNITLDLVGRQAVMEDQMVDMYNVNDQVVQEVYFSSGGQQALMDIDLWQSQPDDIHRPGFFRPTYTDEEEWSVKRTSGPSTTTVKMDNQRIQDGVLQGMSDNGRCLSMHQPFASLLVRGIKKHEGRSWYTTHRGPLWIASTAKQVNKDEIKHVEQFYRVFYNDFLPASFPSNYPPSCLLGCVSVIDCLAQEQYQELYPGGESDSPYVWICENPRELSTHFPIRGQHKIYKLDPTIHQAAKKMLHMRTGPGSSDGGVLSGAVSSK